MLRTICAVVGLSILWAAWSEAQVPARIHYQGRLFNRVSGEPEEGLVRFRFRLWNTPGDDGNPADDVLYWEEAHGFEGTDGRPTEKVLVDNGFYEVELGRNTPLPAVIFSATDVHLEIQVENDPPMTPRQRILSVAYAFQADLLDGKQGSEFAAAEDLVLHASDSSAHHKKTTDAAEIATGVFSASRIPAVIARVSDLAPLEEHVGDLDNPHKVTLQQAGAVTFHNDLIGAKGHLGHAAIDAHVLGLVASSTTPLYDHRCPDDMVQVGSSCMDKQLYRESDAPLASTWFEAAVKCTAQGKRLCSNSEWYVGCLQKDTLEIEEIDGQEEWVDQWATDITGTSLLPVLRGGGFTINPCESIKTSVQSESFNFRCCR